MLGGPTEQTDQQLGPGAGLRIATLRGGQTQGLLRNRRAEAGLPGACWEVSRAPESGSQSGLLTGARELTVPMMISLFFLFLLFLTLGGQVLLPASVNQKAGRLLEG